MIDLLPAPVRKDPRKSVSEERERVRDMADQALDEVDSVLKKQGDGE